MPHMTTVPTDPTLPLDPGREVPAEYDVFCEACGYSLIGIAADRCPECGAAYDPAALPFARVPWLHRRRLGRTRAYWSTVGMVLRRPRRFAEELCRPVRVSAADAASFRALTIRIAAVSVALAAAGITAVVIAAWPGGAVLAPGWWAAVAGFVVLAFVSTTVFLRLATDMPTFIWRGLPSRPPTELAPVHHYASAPLALMPALALVAVAAWSVFVSSPDESVARLCQRVVGAGAFGVVFVSWRVALQLMSAVTGSGRRRVVLLSLYLPVHWLMMAFVVTMLTGAVMGGVSALVRMWSR